MHIQYKRRGVARTITAGWKASKPTYEDKISSTSHVDDA